MEKDEDRLAVSKGDVAHTAVKSILSAVPLVGGPAAELFAAIVSPPLSKRRDEWVEEIANGLEELATRVGGFRIETLSQNEVFITTVMQATQVAIRNHQRVKLEALRNAVLNTAIDSSQENLKTIFLELIDAFTTWHLAALKHLCVSGSGIYYTPEKKEGHELGAEWWLGVELTYRLGEEFKTLPHYLRAQIIRDLTARGLILTHPAGVKVDESFGFAYAVGRVDEMLVTKSTKLGHDFIKFVTSPLEEPARVTQK